MAQELADIGVNCLFLLITDNRLKWTPKMWEEILGCVGFILARNAAEDRDILFRDRDHTKRSSDETKGILEPRPPLTPPAPLRRNGRRNRSQSITNDIPSLDLSELSAVLDAPNARIPEVRAASHFGGTAAIYDDSQSPDDDTDEFVFPTVERKRSAALRSVQASMTIVLGTDFSVRANGCVWCVCEINNFPAGRTKVQSTILKSLLEMIDANYGAFTTAHIQRILDSLDRLLSIVHRVNSDGPLWKDLSKHTGLASQCERKKHFFFDADFQAYGMV